PRAVASEASRDSPLMETRSLPLAVLTRSFSWRLATVLTRSFSSGIAAKNSARRFVLMPMSEVDG
ncbi:MAG TPA: hypothetical protein VI260_22395, partial [Blastocatellia bacterium]